MSFELNVVLVRTIYSSNIGATARAMANMGADRLILVEPNCEVDIAARQGAAGAQFQLCEHVVYKDWDHFYAHEGAGLRLAFTRRDGKLRTVQPLKEVLDNSLTTHPQNWNQPVYLIFGPEDHGLNSDDMAFTNVSCSLPTYGEFQSLNLAQAVLLALYICQDFLKKDSTKAAIETAPANPRRPMYFPDESIKRWLTAMGFDIRARRASAYITLRKLLLQNQPTDQELHVLEAILQQNIRKLEEAGN